MRRGAAGLVVFYALHATYLLPAAWDILFARVKRVEAGAGFACAGHGCACLSEADCREGCCCFPAADAPHAAPREVPLAMKDQSTCLGSDEAARVQPAVLDALPQSAVSRVDKSRDVPGRYVRHLPLAQVLDKVPICA